MITNVHKRTKSMRRKVGTHVPHGPKYRWIRLLLPVTGVLALVWFLVRVIPKPSRAIYPCQRVAAPLAGGLMAWLVGAVGSTLAYRKARLLLRRSRYVVAAVFLSAAVMVIWIPVSVTDESSAFSAFTPSDPPNSPIGVGKGIHPGRVVWVHEPSVTQWDGLRGDWWYDENTDQEDITNTIDIRDKIIDDLLEGTLLPDDMGAIGRFNGTVSKVLLAKALMQMYHNYDEALILLKDVRNNGTKPDGS